MKLNAPKIVFALIAAITLAYTLFLIYGVTSVGFRTMAPLFSLEAGLVSICFACHSWMESRRCEELLAEFKGLGPTPG